MRKVAPAKIHWKPSWRVIPTRYPEINLWKRVTAPADEAAVQEIEQLTNNRVRQESGEIHVLRSGDFFPESCSVDVKASFVYRGRHSRFSTTSFGAYYAAASLHTAICEKAHRTIMLLKEAKIPATRTEMRVIKANIHAKVDDIRGHQKKGSDLYHRSSYVLSQAWATQRWTSGSQGIVYNSVRDPKGECVAIFSPQTIAGCRKDCVLTFEWDGINVIGVKKVKEFLYFKEV